MRRAFSLVEALLASVLLSVIVLAVGAAISTGRDLSIEGQKRILSAMAADDLLSELAAQPYADLLDYDALDQPVGELATLTGEAYPDSFWMIGRSVEVVEQDAALGGSGVIVRGRSVGVSAYDENRVLVTLETFIPEPAS